MRCKFLACSLFLWFSINAQTPGNNIFIFGLSTGFFSSAYLASDVSNRVFGGNLQHSCPILNVYLQKQFSEKNRIGLAFSYDHYGVKDHSFSYNSFSYMLKYDNVWKQKKKLNFCWGLAIGIGDKVETNEGISAKSPVKIKVHINLFELEWRFINNVIINTGIGFGVSGVFNTGGKVIL